MGKIINQSTLQKSEISDIIYSKFAFFFQITGNNNIPMNTLDQVLQTALQLPYEQQEMLLEILQNRLHESRRAKMAADAQQTLADFHAGKFRRQSAQEVILALRQSLDEPEA